MNYPKPKYGRILRGSEKIIENIEPYWHNDNRIMEGEACYQLDPPINGLSICTRPCWIVSYEGKKWLVIDGSLERVKKEIEKKYPSDEYGDDYEEESSSSSSEDIKEQAYDFTKPISIPKTKRRIGRQRRKQ